MAIGVMAGGVSGRGVFACGESGFDMAAAVGGAIAEGVDGEIVDGGTGDGGTEDELAEDSGVEDCNEAVEDAVDEVVAGESVFVATVARSGRQPALAMQSAATATASAIVPRRVRRSFAFQRNTPGLILALEPTDAAVPSISRVLLLAFSVRRWALSDERSVMGRSTRRIEAVERRRRAKATSDGDSV